MTCSLMQLKNKDRQINPDLNVNEKHAYCMLVFLYLPESSRFSPIHRREYTYTSSCFKC